MSLTKRMIIVTGLGLTIPMAAQAETLTPWTMGTVMPNGDAGMLYMGALGGFAPAFGLDMKIEALRGDPLLLKAVIAGQMDSYIGGPGSPMIAASKGADVRMLGCGWVKQNYILWGKDPVKTLADFKDRKIGISSPGSGPDIFIRASLDNANVPVDSVTFVAAGMPPELMSQTSAGIIDGTATPGEYSARAKAMGLNEVTTTAKSTPLAMQRCYFSRAATIKEKPDLVVRFLAAEMAAYTYSLKHRAETIALTKVVISPKPDAPEPILGYDMAIDNSVIDPTFEPPMDKLRWLRDVLAKSGQINPKWDPEQMIDRGPLLKAREMFAKAGASDGQAASIIAKAEAIK